VTSRDALARLPVTRKSELLEYQKAARPFGGFAAARWGAGVRRRVRVAGPLYEPEGARPDYYRLARALFAAGFREGDLVHNAFSYHMTPAGSMMETAAHALGCTVFPAGVGQTEQQLAAIADLRPNALRRHAVVPAHPARQGGGGRCRDERHEKPSSPAKPSRRACVTRSPRVGNRCFQAYATADIGLIAYETPARDGLVVDEDLIVEIVRPAPATSSPKAKSAKSSSRPFNPELSADPLRPPATSSAVMPGRSGCGRIERPRPRLDGARGPDDQGQGHVRASRADRGRPAAAPEVKRARLVVDNRITVDRMTTALRVGRAALAWAKCAKRARRGDRDQHSRTDEAARRSDPFARRGASRTTARSFDDVRS